MLQHGKGGNLLSLAPSGGTSADIPFVYTWPPQLWINRGGLSWEAVPQSQDSCRQFMSLLCPCRPLHGPTLGINDQMGTRESPSQPVPCLQATADLLQVFTPKGTGELQSRYLQVQPSMPLSNVKFQVAPELTKN